MMFSHTTIRFSYGPRGPGFGKLASIISAKSVMPQSVGLMPAAMAGERPFSDLCCFKLGAEVAEGNRLSRSENSN
jgi:hypothetical protein